MGIKSLVKRKLQKEIIKPVYVPISEGDILKGRTVLITGGTSGIGYAIASGCLKNGANVIITGRNQERLNEACEKLGEVLKESTSQYVTGEVLDISRQNTIEYKLKEIVNNVPDKVIDVLVNNAGILKGDNLGKTDEESFDDVIGTNLKGTYFMSQEFAKYLIENKIKGNILNISSASGIRPAVSPYMVSKWGENGITLGLAKKLIAHGIVVNAIAPGPTATDMLLKGEKNIKHGSSPSGRYATPEEIANLAVFLISDMGRMIVGDTIYMTGGCANLTIDDMAY